MKLQGTVTALVTPFRDQELDEVGLAYHINHQIEQGVHGVLLLGTTGEAPTLSTDEQSRVISIAVKEAKRRVPIWVGTGSYCTKQTIEKTKRAKDLGADVALVIAPYYNKPTQEGIYRHFEAVATAVEMPIVAYNVPGRCGVNIETSTLLRIAALPNIVGVKETAGNIPQAGDILHSVVTQYPNFSVFSGDDILTLPMMAMGASGIISVVSNLVPAWVVAQTNAALEGRFGAAQEMHYRLLPLYKAAFLETNPIPIKTAMSLCGMPAGDCRLPLCSMKQENINALRQVLVEMQLMRS